MQKFEERFKSPEDYNKIIHGDRQHYNCLAFALGIDDYEFVDFMLDDWSFERIEEAFQYKAEWYRIGIEQVPNINDIYGHYGFILFGWVCNNLYLRKGFHVARVQPNGQIVHKLGVKELAGYTSLEDLLKLYSAEPRFYFKFTGELNPLPSYW